MARSVTAEAEDFARFFFRLVEEQGGTWLTARDLLEQAVAAYPTHPFVEALAEKPARRGLFTAAAERVREAEFPDVERRKAGTRRNAPVQYRAPESVPSPMAGSEVEGMPDASAVESTREASAVEGTRGAPAAGLPACLASSATPALCPGGDAGPRLRLGRADLHLTETRSWWWRLLEPVLRVVDRLQAALAGR